MSTANALGVALAALLTLCACPPTNSAPCSTDEECPDGRCRFGACGPVCLDDGECARDQHCTAGACVARAQCTQSSECASGFACNAGRCQCSSDDACAANQVCTQGACVTRAACTSNTDCTGGKHCEVTQGLCIDACVLPTDCAPGVDPNVANALFFCQSGDCLRRCVNDATCGQDLICRDGFCRAAECTTFSECAQNSYCTSATNGRCQAYTTCTDTSQCEANFECRPFAAEQCPPGFPCEQSICQELPRCLIDADCTVATGGQPSFCENQHCQLTVGCFLSNECAPGQDCIASLCVPGGCRGHSDCAAEERCTDGQCKAAPPANDVRLLSISPRTETLVVGGTLQLHVVAYRFDGTSYPLQTATFEVLGNDGQPSTAATIDADGTLTAVSAASVRVRASLAGATAPAVEATLTVLPQLASGRRVVVIDQSTRRVLSGVEVVGCDSPPVAAPCPTPVSVATDSSGIASFPDFTGAQATFTAASAEIRADGLPRYDRVSVLQTSVADVMIPLTENPTEAAAGFTASISFTETHGTGNLWIGFAATTLQDVFSADLKRLLGETFQATIPGVGQQFPIPGSVVAYQSPAFGITNEIKGRAYGLSDPGRRHAVSFAGKTDTSQLLTVRSTDLLAYASAFDYAVEPPISPALAPRVPDATDLDGDGRCAEPQICPGGTETIPDYPRFPTLGFSPSREQQRRTEVVIPNVPAGLDTVVITAVETLDESGLVPLGFSSRTGGQPDPDGTRPVEPVLLRSGAPYAGVEIGRPGVFVLAIEGSSTAAPETPSNASGRLTRDPSMPVRVALPPFLPLATGSSYNGANRTLTTAQPGWNALASAGAELARVTVSGTSSRHVIWFPVSASQTGVRIPEAAAGLPGVDPAGELSPRVEVVGIDLSSEVPLNDALDSTGANLSRLPSLISGYSRFVP